MNTRTFPMLTIATSISSAGRRGYSHDSEVAVGVSDENTSAAGAGSRGNAKTGELAGQRLLFAYSLRIDLWKKHLKPQVGQPPATRDLFWIRQRRRCVPGKASRDRTDRSVRRG